VHVGSEPLLFLFPAQLVAKAVGVIQEEGAGARCLSFAAKCDLVGPVGDAHAAEVADVLADRQRSVNELAGQLARREAPELGGQLL